MWSTGGQVITIDPADFTTGALMGQISGTQIPYEAQVGSHLLGKVLNNSFLSHHFGAHRAVYSQQANA